MKTKKYILTGGPGTGKSAILLALEQRGEYIIPEAAADIIHYQKALGNKKPWKNSDFQDWILKLQLLREKRIPKGVERVFIDRGVLDGAAYYQKEKREYSPKLKQAIKEMTYEKRVFLIESMGSCEKTRIRREALEESLYLERIQEQNYKDYGYKLTRIGPGTVDERVEEILKNGE